MQYVVMAMFPSVRRKTSDFDPISKVDSDNLVNLDACLDHPVVLLGRGGSGTRILSEIAQNAGVFLGNKINVSGDSVEWTQPVYDLAVQTCTGAEPDLVWTGRLRDHARSILNRGGWNAQQPWGWKLPESMLILPEILSAFPKARLVHLVRHPITASLRRTHMTSRLDNPVGRATLNAAYRHIGRSETAIENDEPWKHNAISWLYQVGQVAEICSRLNHSHYLEVRFEDLCETPDDCVARIATFLNIDRANNSTAYTPAIDIDLARATGEAGVSSPDTDLRAAWVWSLCAPIAEQFGYEADPAQNARA